ncbi:MAG TPA: GNAT family N-acetyltransferase [Steroidobacteraceae bacterium]|nr:GNAT family N-acetyltransferase [Steroidobacteraceae bacterium]
MHKSVIAPFQARLPVALAGPWLARRWYYTPRTHRAYSVRQISSGDRRLLNEFARGLGVDAGDRDLTSLREHADMLSERVLAGGSDMAVGFAALESTGGGDRVIGACAYAPDEHGARFSIAVAKSYREEQVGRTLLSTLVRQAKRAGVPFLLGEMSWSNRPMQLLAMSVGFRVEPVPRDRNLRRLVLTLK